MIHVGFNTGDGIVYFTVKASRTPDIVHVDEYSNVEIPGKFAFRIDTSDISDGGCNTKNRFYDTVKTFSGYLTEYALSINTKHTFFKELFVIALFL